MEIIKWKNPILRFVTLSYTFEMIHLINASVFEGMSHLNCDKLALNQLRP